MSADEGNHRGVDLGEISVERDEADIAVLTVRGEHDLNTAAQLRERLEALIGERRAVVVDLSPATFVDSSILGVILEARRIAEQAGRGYAVAHAEGAPAVTRVLEITGLRGELPVHESVEAASSDARAPSGGSG